MFIVIKPAMKFEKLENIPTQLLKSTLEMEYQIFAEDIIKLGGYSNRTFHVKETSGTQFIARVANPLKTDWQLNNESYLLTQLHKKEYHTCPKVIDTINGISFTYFPFNAKKFPLQVFKYITGSVNYRWEERCSKADIHTIFTQLAYLHEKMRQIPIEPYEKETTTITINILLDSAIKNQSIGQYLADKQQIFLKKASRLTQLQDEIIANSENLQWIHGDIHLENLLFLPDNTVAFIDFENVQITALELDIIFSAFRIAKIGKADEKLIYKKVDLHTALASYASQNSTFQLLADQFDTKEQLWKALFCLDQALLYLTQAYKGVWELKEGIGFLACFNEVLAYEE